MAKNCGFGSWNIGNTSGDGIAMVTETYGCFQTDMQWDSMDEKSMGTCYRHHRQLMSLATGFYGIDFDE